MSYNPSAGGGGVTEISAQVRANLGIAVPNNVDTMVTTFTLVNWNNGPMYNVLAQDRLTVPAGEGGRYIAFAWTSWPTLSMHLTTKFWVNGVGPGVYNHPVRLASVGGSWNNCAVAMPLDLAALDYVSIVLRQDSGGVATTNDELLFSMYKVH